MRLTGRQQRQERDSLLQTVVAAQTNPPLIDRSLRKLQPETVLLLTLMARSRRPVWSTPQLLTLLSALGVHEGATALKEALEYGLLFPYLRDVDVAYPWEEESFQASHPAIEDDGSSGKAALQSTATWPRLHLTEDISSWLAVRNHCVPQLFVHPAVGERVRQRSLPLPQLAGQAQQQLPGRFQTDGWDWPLRLAALWQRVRQLPVRLTHDGQLYKKDKQRLQTEPLFHQGWQTGYVPTDAVTLSVGVATASGLLQKHHDLLRAAAFPAVWYQALAVLLAELLPQFLSVAHWDPLRGQQTETSNDTVATSTAGWLILWLLAAADPQVWIEPADLAAWLWSHHPYWAGTLSDAEASTGGVDWVNRWLLTVAVPLQVVETWEGGVRLTPLGRWYCDGTGDPPATAPLEPSPTLLMQPNAQIVAYRQGLTPALVAELSQWAQWQSIGPACVLQLQEDYWHQALEMGWTLPQLTQWLQRHTGRPVPHTVIDLLERWGDRRERFTVFPSAVVVEFANAEDLEWALAQGWIHWRIGERFGLTADGAEPDLRHFRLLANRNYQEPPQPCLRVLEDGLTVEVDPIAADLFIDWELSRLAEPLEEPTPTGTRRYRIDLERLRRAVDTLTLDALESWWLSRSGAPMPPLVRFLALGPQWPAPRVQTVLVLRLPNPEAAEALLQWPKTRPLVVERLGPTALVISAEHLPLMRQILAQWGIPLLLSDALVTTDQACPPGPE